LTGSVSRHTCRGASDHRRCADPGSDLHAIAMSAGDQNPHESLIRYHAAKNSVPKHHEHQDSGSISATTVPTPAAFWCCWANVTISAKFALSGVTALIGESQTP